MSVINCIHHPETFKTGTRILALASRPKDGASKNKTIFKASYGVDEFNKVLDEFIYISAPGQRIYATAGCRNIEKAVRKFKERQLNAGWDRDPFDFYKNIEARWISCLLQPENAQEKYWLFDCDDEKTKETVLDDLTSQNIEFYGYPSKSGYHYVVKAFDSRQMSSASIDCINKDALMLWGYYA